MKYTSVLKQNAWELMSFSNNLFTSVQLEVRCMRVYKVYSHYVLVYTRIRVSTP